MDDQGRLHVSPEVRQALEKRYGKDVDVTDSTGAADLLIQDAYVAAELAGMNRAARLVFRSERRRGATEDLALERARESIFRLP